MTRARFIRLLATTAFLASLFFRPASVSAANTWQQQTGTITGSGHFSEYNGPCGDFSITFNPAGGPVTGSLQADCPLYANSGTYAGTKIGEEIIQATLIGTFEGGDGGVVHGTVETGQLTDTFTVNTDQWCTNCVPGNRSIVDTPWEGNLRADGTGSGWIRNEDLVWDITYSAAEFQAGLATPSSTMATLPTLDSGLNLETLEPLPSVAVDDVAIDENFLDVVTGPSSEVVKTWPDLDTSIAESLNQDDAIIARDDQGNFYVIDNQGVKRPLPDDLQSNLQMNNEFGLLQNANLLWASPAVQAFAAAKGEGALDAITGSGAYQYYAIPIWLQQRQYMKASTSCGEGSCLDLMTISVVDTSIYFPGPRFASSEHGSVRGTINGGGDFIYVPSTGPGRELASLTAMRQGARIQPYLGVAVKARADGAAVQMVQNGSPAEQGGLLVGDLITTVNGVPVDSKNPLAALIGQHSGGDLVEMSVLRNGAAQTVQITLANMLQPMIITPSAEITVTDNTELVIDIGLNGATALYVLADMAHVREPITGSEMDVPAGTAVIVLAGYAIGDPIPIGADDVNTWWHTSQSAATAQVPPAAGPAFTLNITLFQIGLAIVLFVILSVVAMLVIVVVRRKKRRAATK